MNDNNNRTRKYNPNYKYAKAWKERQKSLGMKRIELYLKPDVYGLLKAIRDETKQSYGDILSPLIESLARQLAVPLWDI